MTPQEALVLARAYVERELPGAVVTGLLENDRDYLIDWEWDPPAVVLGDAILVMNKRTGTIRELPSAMGWMASEMTPVQP